MKVLAKRNLIKERIRRTYVVPNRNMVPTSWGSLFFKGFDLTIRRLTSADSRYVFIKICVCRDLFLTAVNS